MKAPIGSKTERMCGECWPGIDLGGSKKRIKREESGTKSVRIGGGLLRMKRTAKSPTPDGMGLKLN